MSKIKITGKVLVVQLGRDETQLVLVDGGQILHTAAVATPEGAVDDGMIRNTEAVRDMLKAAVAEPQFRKTRQAVFTMCTSQVITETIITPEISEAKLNKLLKSNVDMYFPVDMHDYEMVWQPIGPKTGDGTQKEMLVQLWAVPKAMLARYYTVANSAGLSLVAVDYCGNSVASAVGASFAKPVKIKAAKTKAPKGEKQPRKKLDLNAEISFGRKKKAAEEEAPALTSGKESTDAPRTDLHMTIERDLLGMTFVQGGQVVFQRFIRCGAQPSYQFGELAMMIEYFRSMEAGRGSRIRGILSGTLSTEPGLAEYLSDFLAIPVSLMNVNWDTRWTLCLGASLTTMDFGDPNQNKPGQVKRQVKSRLWQYVLVLVAGVTMLGMTMYLLSSRLVWNSAIGNLESNVQTLTIQSQKTANFANNYKTYSSLYDRYSADWDTVFSSMRTYNDNLSLVLEELESILPEKSSVTNMVIAAEGLQVEFASTTKEEAAWLIMALRDLKYAIPLDISNLRGGGMGPATSYGNGEEEAPEEGSSNIESVAVVTESFNVTKYMDKTQVVDAIHEMSEGEQNQLKKIYGKAPTKKNLDDNGDHRAALREMLVYNPYAALMFKDLMLEDYSKGGDSILIPVLMDDGEELMASGRLDTVSKNREYMEIFVDELLVKNETTMEAAETLICSNADLESWYVYYIEKGTSVKFPYLDTKAISQDLVEKGSFSTGNGSVDQKMNALVSQKGWDQLEAMGQDQPTEPPQQPTEKPTEPDTGDSPFGITSQQISDYLYNGSTGTAMIDILVNKYMTEGSSGMDAVDKLIGNYITSGAVDDEIGGVADYYIKHGEAPNPVLNTAIERYFSTGDTGNKDMNKVLDRYIESGKMDNALGQLAVTYCQTGNVGNSFFNQLLSKYNSTGTTGNKKVDKVLAQYWTEEGYTGPEVSDDNTLEAQAAEKLPTYLMSGTTGNETTDKLLYNWLVNGSSGNTTADKKLADYLNAGKLNGTMMNLANTYSTTGNTTKSPVMDKFLSMCSNNQIKNKTFNTLILRYFSLNNGISDEEMDAILDQLLNGMGGTQQTPGGTGTGVGGGGQAVDTRITFTVILGYNEQLKNEELLRKGLTYSDKVEKVEVEQ